MVLALTRGRRHTLSPLSECPLYNAHRESLGGR
jgi:hypothetical protein